MSSQIDPDPKPAKPAAQPAKPAAQSAKPAAQSAKPAAQPAQQPASGSAGATARPAAAKAPPNTAPPSSPPAAADHDDGPVVEHRRGGFLRTMPAWAISMLVHIVALLVLALVRPPVEEKPPVRVITSTPVPEVEEAFEEFEEDLPVEDPVETEMTEMVVPTETAVVEDVQVVTDASDIDAAPVAFEFTDFGTETAPAADMLSAIGAAGGTAGGFGGRTNASQLAAANGGGKDTEKAVDLALKWFARHQMPDGGWSFDFRMCPSCQGQCSHFGNRGTDRAGATAMALMPFLGRGYTHKAGPFKKEVESGMAFLAAMTIQGKGKSYGNGGSMYSQGLVGIALSECYGMTQDNRLQGPAQLSLNYIMQAQDPVGGGWRYSPRQPGDTSAVGWCLMALKSGNMAYLQINPLTVKKTIDFLDAVQSDSGATYGYLDKSTPSATRSAVGLLLRMYLGWKKDNPALKRGIERLAKAGPTGNLYHDYYCTQLMHHMEGDVWISWNEKMKKMLLGSQAQKGHENGSWYEGVDKGGHAAEAGGRLYTTSLATMMLEVYYRHMPIYRNQSVDEEFKE